MKKDEYLYIGFAIPQEEMNEYFKKDPFPSIQSNKFNWNVIKSLEDKEEINIEYICTAQVSNYPLFPKKYFSKKEWNVSLFNRNIEILEIPYINTEILKLITRFLSVMYYGIKKLMKLENKKGVIVCDIHTPFMLGGYLLSKLFKINYISIWTDPPAIATKRESLLKAKLRYFEAKIAKYLMSESDKVIAMTKYLAEDFAPQKPYLIIEGIIDKKEIEDKNKQKIKTKFKKISYTGSLEERYGIKNIIDGFKLIRNEDIYLDIYGRGDYEEEIKKISLEDSRIRYFGFVQNSQILDIQRNSDFLINARSIHEEYTKYSFPSKMMEYMMSGTPIITTILDGFPEEYKKYLIALNNNSPEEISKKIEEVLKWNKEDKEIFGKKAQNFILKKSYVEQGEKIRIFLEGEKIC